MSTVVPSLDYLTVHAALANTSKTTVFTCGTDGEPFFYCTGISVATSDGTAGAATVIHDNGTEYVLIYNGDVLANLPLDLVGNPCLLLRSGDTIKVTSSNASGSHPMHVTVTGVKGVNVPG